MLILITSDNPGDGKDTVADYISEDLNCDILAFANDIKEIAYSLGWDGKKDNKGRQLLIDIGESAKKYDPYIWVKKELRKIDDKNKTYIISDLRYNVEYEYIKKVCEINNIKMIIIKVVRQQNIITDIVVNENQKQSKKMPYIFLIENNGSIYDLYLKIDGVIKQIKEELL